MAGVRPLCIALLLTAGCPDSTPPSTPPPQPQTPSLSPAEKADTRFMKIRALLQEKPESRRRAVELFPLVKPICEDESERAAFIATAKWSASFSSTEVYETKTLAGDVIEHVATTCFRDHPKETFALLDEAKAAIPDMVRFDLIRARLAATSGDFETALASAQVARAAGSIHALALTANIQAQLARNRAVGYRPGMLDEAIATVGAEPDNTWPLVNLAAVLSTRARLLTERAVWENGDDAKKTLLLADAAYERLSHSPFIENIRTRAQDVLCFNAIEGGLPPLPCKRAAEAEHHLGAAFAAGIELGEGFDQKRFSAIEQAARRIEEMPPKRVVVIVARGDESELIEWARPAARYLGRIAVRRPRVIAVDRTESDRAHALFQRILALAGIEPEVRIEADSTFAMPCLTAVIAKRKTPQACPLEAAQVSKLGRMTDFGVAVLIGRDLDAEIDDLHLYQLEAVLLSFRQSRMEKGIDAWLKSVSDVLITGR